MWVVTNYVISLSALRPKHLREILSSCRDALAGLPHDHCAKFLAHLEAEACALLGDRRALLETWTTNRNYFDGKLEKGEWFETKRKHLLADVPVMARSLENNDLRMYKRVLRGLRWGRFTAELRPTKLGENRNTTGWWGIVWILLWLLITLIRNL
jgi:hypothetical protein